eukprot:TRINITY_DN371_c0_g1_i12.p1 TRINITY_DN371_c0_g1~~TRINITY_DN371_c0_g1_i12.p1  ORF type:complete len:127 (-),score=29.85 TRINITY_DN371_c0_g1_i12:429-809(-)
MNSQEDGFVHEHSGSGSEVDEMVHLAEELKADVVANAAFGAENDAFMKELREEIHVNTSQPKAQPKHFKQETYYTKQSTISIFVFGNFSEATLYCICCSLIHSSFAFDVCFCCICCICCFNNLNFQ